MTYPPDCFLQPRRSGGLIYPNDEMPCKAKRRGGYSMQRGIGRLVLWACLIGNGITGTALATETWADAQFKPTSGLVLWLDASRLPDAWKAHGKPALHDGATL